MTFKSQVTQPGSVQWADTADINHTLRAKVDVTPKNISGIQAVNCRSEVISNRKVDIVSGALSAQETQSIRTSLSGATVNAAQLNADWLVHKANVDAMIASLMTKGFVPTDAVVTTTV